MTEADPMGQDNPKAPRARASRRRLDDALAVEARMGRLTPCQREPEVFTADGHDAASQRAEAARRCHSCPVLTECAEYADAADERWHVWGGTDRREGRTR